MGRSFLASAILALCLSCAGKSAREGAGTATGGVSTDGGTSSGGSTIAGAGTSGAGAAGSAGTREACYRNTFPPHNPARTETGATSAPPSATSCSDAALFCDFTDDACGRVEPDGVCNPRDTCSDDDGPVCGCDGVNYESSCAARALGVDVDGQNLCHLDGQYLCGPTPCALDTEACSAYQSHINGAIRAICVPITPECQAALASGEDRFCECVTLGRCSCRVAALSGGTAVFKLCSDR